MSADGKTVSRAHDGKWGAQLLDTWMSAAGYDEAAVILEFDECAGEGFVGIVGCNFNPGDWDEPLNRSMHAVAARTDSGNMSYKMRPMSLAKCAPVQPGCRVSFEVDMVACSMTMQVLGARPRRPLPPVGPRPRRPAHARPPHPQVLEKKAEGAEEAKILSSVIIEDLPVEIAVVVCFGPCKGGSFKASVVGSSCEKTGRDRNKKTAPGLHDAENTQTLEDEAGGGKVSEATKIAQSCPD